MAIAFIPVRDQSKVFRANRESSLGKGTVLKRLSTGKKISDPRDNPSDYQKVSNMKVKLAEQTEAIKQASLGTSLFEVALSTYQLLEEYYADLEAEANAIKANPVSTTAGADADEKKYRLSLINSKLSSINNLISTTFDGNQIAAKGTTGTTLKVAFSGGYNPLEVALSPLKEFKSVTNGLYDDTVTTTTDNYNGKLNADITTATDSDNLLKIAEANKSTAAANYKLLMAGITNIANIERLAEVQKTNTTAAISALEDIDVQEEIMELMQAQILEELSSEALIKIKESSKYIINLIRA